MVWTSWAYKSEGLGVVLQKYGDGGIDMYGDCGQGQEDLGVRN